MSRVTNKTFINNVINNISPNFEKLQDANFKIASGRKLNKPSDDPLGMSVAMGFRSKLSEIGQIERNISQAKSWLSLSETVFETVGNKLIEAKTLATKYASANIDSATAIPSVEGFIADVTNLGNTTLGNRHIFGGFKTSSQPFASGSLYSGDGEEINTEFDFGLEMAINIQGSEFLSTDLNPDINGDTLLASLNKGSGVAGGSIAISDRGGNSATVDISGFTTVAQVVSAISNEAGVNVTARINDTGTGITVDDDNTALTGALTVTEVGSGTTASDLGILTTNYGSITGRDLDTAIDSTTPLSLLNGGNGINLSDISIFNGAASGTVTFSSLTSGSTIGDVISLINASSMNVTAGINSNGTALTIDSKDSKTIAIVTEVGSGSTASDLGVGGARNALLNLEKLLAAIQASDNTAISASLENLTDSHGNISRVRGVVGGRINRLEASKTFLARSKVDTTSLLSDTVDTDIEKAAMDLLAFQNAYKVSLASSARILNVSILDFLR